MNEDQEVEKTAILFSDLMSEEELERQSQLVELFPEAARMLPPLQQQQQQQASSPSSAASAAASPASTTSSSSSVPSPAPAPAAAAKVTSYSCAVCTK